MAKTQATRAREAKKKYPGGNSHAKRRAILQAVTRPICPYCLEPFTIDHDHPELSDEAAAMDEQYMTTQAGGFDRALWNRMKTKMSTEAMGL